MRRRLAGLAIVAAIVAALVIAEALTGGSGKRAGREAPALPTQVLVPPRATLASLRGHPAVIHFWASWCDPCRKEAPHLAKLPAALGARARLVGVDWNDSLSGARGFIRRYGWRFQNLRDKSGSVGDSFALAGLPTTYILDSEGHIRASLPGPQTVASVERALRAVKQ